MEKCCQVPGDPPDCDRGWSVQARPLDFYVGFIKTNALSAIAVEAGVQPQEFFQIRLFHSFQLQEIFTGLQFLIQIQDREISEGRGQIVFL